MHGSLSFLAQTKLRSLRQLNAESLRRQRLLYGGNNAGTLAAFDVLGKKTRQYPEDRAAEPSGAVAQWLFDESERSRAKGKS